MLDIGNINALLDSDEDINKVIIKLDAIVTELCNYGETLEELNPLQRTFFFNQLLEKEVNNGGFKQYFINTSGEFAHETIQSLREIEAHKTAEILQLAINEFPEAIVPKNRVERVGLIEEIEYLVNEVWSELDQHFYRYEDDLNFLNFTYVKENRHLF